MKKPKHIHVHFGDAVQGSTATVMPNTDAKNHLGERSFRTYEAWKRAIKEMYPGASFEGDKDIAQARANGKGVGEWDGEQGSVYTRDACGCPACMERKHLVGV